MNKRQVMTSATDRQIPEILVEVVECHVCSSLHEWASTHRANGQSEIKPQSCSDLHAIICDVYPCQHQRFVNQIVGMRDAHAGLARALVRTFHSSD